ncbi:MAG: A/G-specific adenine glycosylase [Acetobacteraceae bacterium]|nr:A/G-specific adenine glycosylase [Acetobacteraceae bacterium]
MLPPAADLLAWYDRHRRALPWRALPGEQADPYRVWLSEVMLQQTTVAAVAPFYQGFLARFPDIGALAAAPVEDVLAAWAGLGYYARARRLHACAKVIAERGGFPSEPAALRALPGIGAYTAAAIAAIAFDTPVVPVDSNVERVVARVFAVAEPLPSARPVLTAAAAELGADPAARARPSDFAQALFDLGAGICTSAVPACAICPWRDFCAGRIAGVAASLPRKERRKPRPYRYGVHFWIADARGRVLLRRRPSHGLFGGMIELPGTPWRDTPWSEAEALPLAPVPADWTPVGIAHHSLTHLELRLAVYAVRVERIDVPGMLWDVDTLDRAGLPTVMRRCVRLVTEGLQPVSGGHACASHGGGSSP